MKIITGMHRSGTSLVAGMFYKLGLDLGNSKKFTKPDKHNPYGYFENFEIVNSNKKILHGFLGKLNYIFYCDFKFNHKRYKKFEFFIDKIEAKYKDCYVKDNRFSLTIGFWPKKIKFIIFVVRSPISIAKSLKKRNYIPNFLAFKLWRIHVLSVIQKSYKIPKLFISYENLVNKNKRLLELKKISKFILKEDSINLDPLQMNKILENDFNIEKYQNKESKKHIYNVKYKIIWNYLQRRAQNDKW